LDFELQLGKRHQSAEVRRKCAIWQREANNPRTYGVQRNNLGSSEGLQWEFGGTTYLGRASDLPYVIQEGGQKEGGGVLICSSIVLMCTVTTRIRVTVL
jgi:hypothetical protein